MSLPPNSSPAKATMSLPPNPSLAKISRMPYVLYVKYTRHEETHDGYCSDHGSIEVTEETKEGRYQVPLFITPEDVNPDGTLNVSVPYFDKRGGCGGGSGYCGAESYYDVEEARIQCEHTCIRFNLGVFSKIRSKCASEYNDVMGKIESTVARITEARKNHLATQQEQVDKHNSQIRAELNRLVRQYGRGNVPHHLHSELKKKFIRHPSVSNDMLRLVKRVCALEKQRDLLRDYYQGTRLFLLDDYRCHNDVIIQDLPCATSSSHPTETRVWCMFWYSGDPQDLPPTWTDPAPQTAGFYGYWCQ